MSTFPSSVDLNSFFRPGDAGASGPASPPSPIAAPASGIADVVRAAAEKNGVPVDLALRISGAESANRPDARNSKSTAGGLFQLLDSTYEGMGGQPGKKLDPEVNADIGTRLIRSNMDSLSRALGRAPTYGEIYAAHFFGPGVAKMIQTSGRDTPIEQGLAAFERPERVQAVIDANPQLRGKTVGQVLDSLGGKVGDGSAPSAKAAAGSPASTPRQEPFYTPRQADKYVNIPSRQGASAMDFAKEFFASAASGFGSVGQAAGEAAAFVANKVTGTEQYEGKNLLEPAAQSIRDSMSEGGKQARAEAEVKGDITDLSSIELPQTAQGWGMLLSGGLGSVASSLLPFVGQAAKIQRLHAAGKTAEAARAAAVLKGGAAAYGGAMTGGAAADEVRDTAAKTVAGMTHEQLMAEVPAYAESFSKTGDEQQARDAVVNFAARSAGLAASVFGAAGGVFNAKIIEDILLKKGVSAALGKVGGGVVGRTAIGTAGGSITEAGQETGEKVGQNIGENVGLGRPAMQDATRNTAADAIGGALAGGPVGAVAGAASRAPAAPAIPPQAQPAAEKAREPNSPLSKAAVAGATADAAAQASAPPAPAQPEDPILARAAEIKAAVQQGGLLDALRLPDSPVNTKQFLNDLAAASSRSTGPALREQAMERLEFALGWAGQNVANVPKAPGLGLDELPGVVAGDERPAGPRPSVPQLRTGADRDAALLAKRGGAMTEFERRQLDAQRQVNLEQRMRAAPAPQAAPAPSEPGIAPAEQNRLEAASMAGDQANRRREDEPRQIVIDRALRNVEERGGVASPQEAQIFAEAGVGKPYDRIDEGLGPKPDLVLPRMGQADPAKSEGGILLDGAGTFGDADRLARGTNIAPDPRPLPDVVNVNQSGQAGATPGQNATLLGGDRDLGTELAKQRVAQGFVAQAPAAAGKKASKSEDRDQDADQPFAQVQAPDVAIPSGDGPAFLRKRRAMLDQMAGAGFETVERREDGFYLRNARTRQELKLDGAADAQLARAAIKRMVDARANAAATSPQNDRKEPSWAQIDATNWKKGDRFQLNGVTIVVENPVGSVRRSRPDAKVQWETTMKHHYGDIAGTKGADGDPVDVFIGNDPSSPKIFVVDQANEDGSFDEHKVMMGFRSEQDARDGYLANYAPGWQGLSAIREMSQDEFQQWVKDRSATAEPASRPADIAAQVDPASAPGTTFTIRDGGQDVVLTRIDESKLDDLESPARQGKARRLSRRNAALIRKLAQGVFGKKVVFFADDDGGRRAGDGFVIPSDPSTIYLREVSTISHLAVFGHELMHTLRAENPAAYDAIAAVVSRRVKDAKGFRRDYYGAAEAERRGDAPLTERKGGELEELIADLGGNQMRDASFWKEVFDEIARNEPAAEAKSAIARLVELVQRLVAQLVEGMKGPGFKADEFINDGKAIRAALRDGLARYVKEAGLTRTSMQAEVLRAEQDTKRSTDRPDRSAEWDALEARQDGERREKVRRAHTQLKKIAFGNWSATTDLRDEGIPVLLRTRTSAGAYVTSATEFVDGAENTRNVGGTPPGGPINQMTIGEHHKKVVQRFREMAKLAGIRKSQDRKSGEQTDAPEFKAWFKDSKVVDADGKPLVVYHGTYSLPGFDGGEFSFDAKGINDFGDADLGFFFGGPNVANAFAGNDTESGILPVYLSIQNPLSVRGAEYVRMLDEFKPGDWRRMKRQALRDGHDGIVVMADEAARSSEYGDQFQSDNYIAFRPTQIKSAIGNSGAFDPTNPDITRSPERGIHFSTSPRKTIDGRYYGRGLRGLEAERLRQSQDPRLKERTYFYVDEGNGVRPEAGVGGYAHEVDLPPLYDAKADPLRIWNSGDLNGTESEILDAGFGGYFVKKHETGQGFAVVIGQASHSMSAKPLESAPLQGKPAAPAPTTASRGLMSREMREIDVLSIPGARMKAGTLIVPVGSIDAANDELQRIGSDIRFSSERIDSPADEYRSVEQKYRDTDQWLKAPNGQRTRLSERQWVQVRTPSFKKWFGDWESFAGKPGGVWADDKGSVSKAVDENGEPLVVYHGSSEGGFMVFREPTGKRRGDLGIFAAKDEGMAASYVRRARAKRVENPAADGEQTGWRYVSRETGRPLFTMRLGDSPETIAQREAANNATAEPMYGADPAAGDQPGIYALFMNVRNPNESDFEGANWDGSRYGQWMVRDEDGEPVYDDSGKAYFDGRGEAMTLAMREGGWAVPAEDHYETTDSVVRDARSSKQDGAIIRNVVDSGGGAGSFYDPSDVFVVFDPNQVKSADFNDGSYSVSDDDIRRSVERAFENENRISVVVGGKPGEMGWDFTKQGVPPPPFQAPTVYGPRLDKMGESVRRILSSRGVASLAEAAFGIKGMRVIPLKGSWLTKPEPSFALVSDEMTYEQAVAFSKMLGFAFAQDAMITYQPTPDGRKDGIPALYIGSDNRLSPKQFKAAADAAREAGLDYSTTHDGTAMKFLYFGGDAEYDAFFTKVSGVQRAAGLKYLDLFYARSDLHEANDYVPRGDGGNSAPAWVSDSGAGPSGLFGRTVDHLLVPYAKAVGAEGYRFALQRFGDLFGLDAQQRELIRNALIPKSGISKSTVPIASGVERLEVEGRGATGKTPVSAIIYALQNRSAQAGLIEPGDYSDRAMRTIAEAIADEVVYHLRNPREGKSAIGWYDTALKAAKANYASIFPELRTDRDAEMLFDAIWGITSQGNDVFSNSVFGARVYQIVRNGGAKLPDAVSALKGSFGGETVAIENNLLKLHTLIERNGYDAMRTFFNTKGTVGELNARLRKDRTLFFKDKPLKIDGQADQVVTGWMVFGPKIGSFINNLHGDYSTLTADLWFTRSWNRILGYAFVHSPALEAAQYQKFMSALVAERNAAREDFVGAIPEDFERGPDAQTMSNEDLDRVLTDPYFALQVATDLEEKFRKGGYKQKSTLRRAAKVWVENRGQPEAAPRTDLERSFQQKTAEMAQQIIRRRSGQRITIADIQAALWFYEKDDLFGPLGGTNKKSEGADYASASSELVRVYQRGNLYFNTTDKRFVYGSRGSYLTTFDPDKVNDAIALMREYDKSPIVGARFQLEDQGADVAIVNNADLEARPDVARAAIARMVEVARSRGVSLLITPKVRRGTKARAAVEEMYRGLGFGAANEDGVMRMAAPSQASITRSVERDRNQVESIFDGLARRGLARQRAQDALEARPDAAIIDYVESNFLDLLERLEESGKVKINCE